MDKGKRLKLTKKGLEDILGKKIEEYKNLKDFPYNFEHGVEDPYKILNLILEHGISVHKEVKSIMNIKNNLINSGEIWLAGYDILFLYLGKSDNDKHIFSCLGGDTFEHAVTYTTGDIEKYNFKKKLY